MRASRRVALEPAYLLHQRDFRDSGRIIEFLTRDHGRVCLFARGVRRAGSALAPVLQPFQALLLSWSGSGDGGSLTGCELAARAGPLPAEALMSGFYLNELVLKLLGREDPHPDVHDAYGLALAGLHERPPERALRLFEKRLLEALGFGVDYMHVVGSGETVEPGAYYHVRADRGVTARAQGSSEAGACAGRELLSLAAETLDDAASLATAKRLLRLALEGPLDGRELRTRAVARAVQRATRERTPASGPADGSEEPYP